MNTEYILKKIENQILENNKKTKLDEIGYVEKISDGIAIISGLENIKFNEIIEFQNKTEGIIFSIEEKNLKAVILGEDSDVKAGEIVKGTNKSFKIKVGNEIMGRIIDCKGKCLDGKKDIEMKEEREVDLDAPEIIKRESVKEPLQTGIKVIDALIPIGRGQRELIIGDRQTGKTSIAVDTIINQNKISRNTKNKIYSIYVAIGQKNSSVAKIKKKLEEKKSLKYTSIIVASASDSVPLQFYAPYIGCTIAEYFRDKGMHSLIVYDDLSKHAIAYRQMSLLLRRPPGREAYPGDIFYVHSKLLERAAKLSKKFGGGSLTALPIIETQSGDVSSYIATNIISITDGQIFLESDLFRKGIKPAINIGLSVSRIGSAAQTKIIKNISANMKLQLAQYREMESFSQFGSDLDQETKKILKNGKKLTEMLKQKLYNPLTIYEQFLSLFIASQGYLENIDDEDIEEFLEKKIDEIKKKESLKEDIKQINENRSISDKHYNIIKKKIKNYIDENIKGD